jgi:RimJ/RimL family protein N-acetyltransferase
VSTDWTARPPLTGPRLTLTPISPGDAPGLLAALGPADDAAAVLEHLAYRAPRDEPAARALIEEMMAAPDRIAYAQKLRATGEFVGTTSFYEIAPTVRAVAIGHTWIGRRHWRTGVNTESKLIMLTRAFDGLGAERVVWHTDIRNLRSQRAIERLGAQREGVLRHHRLRLDGSWRDTVQYSMLKDEWPAVRDRLTAALEREDRS